MAKRRRSAGGAIGGILAGFDQQVFRATKPPAELVESAKPLPAIAGSDGSMLSIEVPADSDGSWSPASGPPSAGRTPARGRASGDAGRAPDR